MMLGVVCQNIEARTQELEHQIGCLKLLFKPWPPPSQHEPEPEPPHTKEPAPLQVEVIPAEEQAELDRIEKLLHKAQIHHKKFTREPHKEQKSASEQSQKSSDSSVNAVTNLDKANKPSISPEDINSKHISKQSVPEKKISEKENCVTSVLKQKVSENISNATNIKRTAITSSKSASDGSEKTKISGSKRTSVTQNSRPGSSSGRKKVVPAHINAPFHTSANLPASKLQTTYRSATAVKPAVRGRVRVSSVRGTGSNKSIRTSSSSSSSAKSGLTGTQKDQHITNIESVPNKSQTADKSESGLSEECKEYTDKVGHIEPENCVKYFNDGKLSCHETVIHSQTVIDKESGTLIEETDVVGADHDVDKLFDLRRDGSAIELPVKLRRFVSQNTKLRRKYQTQSLTKKIDSPSSGQDFSALVQQCDKCGYDDRIQSFAKLGDRLTSTYKQLYCVLENLHLTGITEASSSSDLLRCKKHLEFILTEYQDTEELFHRTDFRLLQSVPTNTRYHVKLKTDKNVQSSLMWYNKFSGIPGHQSPDTVTYNKCQDLEKYQSLVCQNQWVSAQLDMMENSAQFILPQLRSLKSDSSDYLTVLRCGYELLTQNSSPVIVKDTVEEEW